MTGDVEARSFGDWSMGFCNMNDWASLQKYGDYVTQSLVQLSFQHDAQNARKFMVKFAERAL
jgi:hypothetical protein